MLCEPSQFGSENGVQCKCPFIVEPRSEQLEVEHSVLLSHEFFVHDLGLFSESAAVCCVSILAHDVFNLSYSSGVNWTSGKLLNSTVN